MFEHGATTSWAFNCKGLDVSGTFRKLIDGDKDGFIVATSQWIHGEGGSVMAGLVRRRATERHVFVRNFRDEVIALNWYNGLLPLIKKKPAGKLIWTGTSFTWG
ncbi:MAG TPA: hypothetical protein V6C86_15190 [Oculatellaceae cyanobacterium]